MQCIMLPLGTMHATIQSWPTIFFTVSFTGTGDWEAWTVGGAQNFKNVQAGATLGVLYSQSPSQPLATILQLLLETEALVSLTSHYWSTMYQLC